MYNKNYQKITAEQKEAVTYIAMNAPETLNAFDKVMLDEMLEVIEHCKNDPDCRVVVIKGLGKGFSAGGDIMGMKQYLDTDITEFFKPILLRVNQLALAIRALPKPVIASVHGAAAGAGFNLALCCDFIIASQKAKFIQAFVNIGLVPDMGGTYFLSKALPPSKTMEFTMLGEVISASSLFNLGMINQLADDEHLEQVTFDFAKKLTLKPKESLSTSKSMVNSIVYPELASILEAEFNYQIYLAKQPDFAEGITAFIEKRPPEFL